MQTITDRLYYTSLDTRFCPCAKEKAAFQLEEYATDKTKIFAISNYTGYFSYSVGQKVDVIPQVRVHENLNLNNVIKNQYINVLSSNREF